MECSGYLFAFIFIALMITFAIKLRPDNSNDNYEHTSKPSYKEGGYVPKNKIDRSNPSSTD